MDDGTRTVLDPAVGVNRSCNHDDTQHREISQPGYTTQGSDLMSGDAIAVDDTKHTSILSSPSDVIETATSHDNCCTILQPDRYVKTIVTSDLKNDSNQSSLTCLDAPSPASDIPSTSASQKRKRLVPISVVLSENDIGKPAVTVWGESEKRRHCNVLEIFEPGAQSGAMSGVLNIGNDINTLTNQQGKGCVEEKYPQAQCINIISPSIVYQSSNKELHNIIIPATFATIDDSNAQKPQDSLCEVVNAHESCVDSDDDNSIVVDVVNLDVSSSPIPVETDNHKSSNSTKSSLIPSYIEHHSGGDKSLIPESNSDGSSDDEDEAVVSNESLSNESLPNIHNALEADRESDICVYSEESIYIMCTPSTRDDADSNGSNILVISDNGKAEKECVSNEEAESVTAHDSSEVSETHKNVVSSDETSKNSGLSSIIERLKSRSKDQKQRKAKKLKQAKIRKMTNNSSSEDVPLSTLRKNLQSRKDKQVKSQSASSDNDIVGEMCKNKKGVTRSGKRKSHELDSPSSSFKDQLTCSGDGSAKNKEIESDLTTASTEKDIVDSGKGSSDTPLKKQAKLDTIRHTEDVMRRFQFISEQLSFLNKESGELETNIHKSKKQNSSKEKKKSRSKCSSKNQTQRKG